MAKVSVEEWKSYSKEKKITIMNRINGVTASDDATEQDAAAAAEPPTIHLREKKHRKGDCTNKLASNKIMKSDYVRRNIVEFCCGPNSRIGHKKYQKDGCHVTRITEDDDVTTNKGLYKAIQAVRQENCLLWVSIPCTGGSLWQNINVKKPGGAQRVKEHKRLFKKIWTAFTIVGRECQSHGGKIAIEWPQGCEYWRMKTVGKFLYDLQLRKVRVDGCALGLTNEKGIPIRNVCECMPKVHSSILNIARLLASIQR